MARKFKKSDAQLRHEADVADLQRTSGLDAETCQLLLEPQDEHYTVDIIKRHLLSPAHEVWLYNNGLSVEDALNGRFGGDVEQGVYDMFTDWNQKLGRKMFGF